jgi:hypothetical protein
VMSTANRSSARRRINPVAIPGRTSTKAEAAANTALTSNPTGIATWKPAYSFEKRTPGVPIAWRPRKPPEQQRDEPDQRKRSSEERGGDACHWFPSRVFCSSRHPRRIRVHASPHRLGDRYPHDGRSCSDLPVGAT